MQIDWHSTTRGRKHGLSVSLASVSCTLVVVALIGGRCLPEQLEHRIASVGWAPAAGFFKSAVIYHAILALVFVHLPLHSLAALAAGMSHSQRATGLARIMDLWGVAALSGTLVMHPRLLGAVLAGLAVAGVPMTLHLLNCLIPGPSSSVFAQLVLLRFVAWWGTAIVALAWYSTLLSRLDWLARSRETEELPIV